MSNLAECHDNESLLNERFESILNSICPGRVARQGHFGDRPYIRLDEGAAQGPFLYEGTGDVATTTSERRIVLSIFPAIGVAQGQVFYRYVDPQRFLALRDHGWVIIPFLRFSIRGAPVYDARPAQNGVSLEAYLSYWRRNPNRIRQVGRDDFDTVFRQLLDNRLMSDEEVQEVRRKFANRRYFDPGPAADLSLSWPKSEAVSLDADGRFTAIVRDRINEALATWGSTLPQD